MVKHINLSALLVVSTASPMDAVTTFFNKLLGTSQSPDGYLMYLLIMCGLFIIGLVFVYNWWEERRFNEQVEKSFSPIKNDALLDQNKKQFLEKFAATTGYLSDAPDAASFLSSHSQAPITKESISEKSIDDVYTELLDTMSKRSNQKPKTNAEIAIENNKHENSDFLPTEVTSQEEVINEIEPAQHHAIKSIIDQVFKNKGFLAQTNQLSSQDALASNQKNAPKEETVLDAFLSAKNAMELQDALPEPDTIPSPIDEKSVDAVNIIDDHELPTMTNSHDNLLAEMIGLSPMTEQSNALPSQHEKDSEQFAPTQYESSVEEESTLPLLLNLHMDLVGVLALGSGAAFGLLVDSFSALYKDFDKPVHVFVQDAKRKWILVNNMTAQALAGLIDSNLPQRIVCSMQIADRSGAVSRNMINRFQLAFEAIAANMGGRVDWQNEGDAFSHAMALDAFCIEVDKTMFFHLMQESNGPFTGTKLKGIAESQGLVLASDGTFKFFSKDVSKDEFNEKPKYPEFVMFNRDNHPFNAEMLRTSVVKSVTFQLDIPHTRPHASALDCMVTVAKNLEVGLNAVLVDDNNRPLGDFQIEKIRDQIKSIHATMQLRGIVPGSDHAHRLFS